MLPLILPENYESPIDLMESQRAIKKIKDYFQQELAYGLNLRRVSAPLFVDPKTGLCRSVGLGKGHHQGTENGGLSAGNRHDHL